MEEEEPVEGLKEVLVIERRMKINGAIWASGPLPKLMPWHGATEYLKGTGWRLPTTAELVGLFEPRWANARGCCPQNITCFWTSEVFYSPQNNTYPTSVCIELGTVRTIADYAQLQVWPVKEN